MSDWASWANLWHGTRWLRTAKWDSGDTKYPKLKSQRLATEKD